MGRKRRRKQRKIESLGTLMLPEGTVRMLDALVSFERSVLRRSDVSRRSILEAVLKRTIEQRDPELRVVANPEESTTKTRRPDGRTVLVVDDDVAFRRDISEALQSYGYNAVAASNGKDAMRALMSTHFRPAAIVLDLNMPEIDGRSFLRWMHLQPHLRKTPVIVATALPEPARPEMLTAKCVLEKPFSVDALLDAVDAAVA